MKTRWAYINNKVCGLTICQKMVDGKGTNEVYLEAGDNYGNVVYTTKVGANLVYNSLLKNGTKFYPNSRVESIRPITDVLYENGIEYKVACVGSY